MDSHPTSIQIIKKIDNYIFDLNDKLGEGSFSQVYKGINTLTNHQVAVKKVRIRDIKSKIARRLLQSQISILNLMDHHNIIKCFDVQSSINNCYIITELCSGGDVDQLMKYKSYFSEEQATKIILPVYEALQYLSNLGIIHRDLKISNIFIHQDTYKLGDFGFAIKSNKLFKDVAIGSPIYMSPQGLIHNLYGPKTDVWSFGILIYELIHGTTPLSQCKTEDQLKKKVLESPSITKNISFELQQLMLNCLRVNQKERYSIQQIGQSSFIRKIRGHQSQQMNIEHDLTLTKFSTSTTMSQNPLSFPQISYETAVSLIHYCRLLNKIQTISYSYVFSKLLVWISVNMQKNKYLSKKYSQEKEANLREIIKEYNQKYLSENSIQVPFFINFQEVMNQCQKKIISQPNLASFFKNFEKQTQILMKCFENGCLEMFCKRSKAKQYANSMQIRG